MRLVTRLLVVGAAAGAFLSPAAANAATDPARTFGICLAQLAGTGINNEVAPGQIDTGPLTVPSGGTAITPPAFTGAQGGCSRV